MSLKTQALSITLCMIVLVPILLSTTFTPVVSADPVTGKTKLYFKDALSLDESNYDSTNTFQLLSDIPPTKENISACPPLVFEDSSIFNGIGLNIENLANWFPLWLTSLLSDSDEFSDYMDGYEDLFESMKLLIPNPLRIVEAYEYMGNESIQLNGNINYDLYFKTKIPSRLSKNDQVKLGLYKFSESSFFPTEFANTTLSLTPSYLEKIVQKSITITNVSETIYPGQLILFTVEILPGNKTSVELISQYSSTLLNISMRFLEIAENIANSTGFTDLEDFFSLIDLAEELFQDEDLGLNLSKDIYEDVLESLISFSFLYDSSDYPSSVTIPLGMTDDSDDSSFTYYLHESNIMDSVRPTAASPQTINLGETSGSWLGKTITRNKIITDASAIVYINHRNIQPWGSNLVVRASLMYGNTTISTDSITLDRTQVLYPSLKPYQFTFDDLGSGVELSYGNKIGLELSLQNMSDANTLFRSVEAFYDASDYASLFSFSLSETDHIQVSETRTPSTGKIIIGDKITYMLDVSSDLQDTVEVSILDETFEENELSFWDISINPESFSISENGNKTVLVTLTSLGTTLAAYDEDPLSITLEVIGNTGYDTVELTGEVSDDAVTYDTLIQKPEDKEVIHGNNVTLTFIIENNNTGLWKDSFIFNAESDENLSVIVDPLTYDDLGVGNKTFVNVTIEVPKNTEIEDATITLKIISKRSNIERTVSVNLTIIGANVIESAFDYFDEIAESFGLKDMFGSYAPIVLVSIIFIVVFFILILMVLILTTKHVEVICVDRIKEIVPGNNATYDVTLKNPSNKMHRYSLNTEGTNDASWNVSLSLDKVTIPGKQQKTIQIFVEATDEVEPGDWKEFQFVVETEGKTKKQRIPLLCSLADGTVSLSINGVFHWPKSFSKDEKVSTSFRLENKGSVQARSVSVKLFINNKEKNKVQELIIPAGGYADITLPWIAEKGKNDLRIVVS